MASIFDLATFGASRGRDWASDLTEIGMGIFGTSAISQTTRDEDKLLQQEEQMVETAYYQQGLQRARNVRETMAEATVQEAARGVSVASPSFKSVQRSSFEKFQEDQDVAALNLSFKKDQLEAQRRIVRDREKASKISLWGKIATDIL